MTEEWFDVAQVCLNGHVVTPILESSPERASNFCQTCGAATVTACEECDAPIAGMLHVPGVLGRPDWYRRPAFCKHCGSPYSWTRRDKEAWLSLAAEVDGLSDEERAQLESAFDDIVADTPATERATTTLRKLTPKIGQEAWDAMKAILISIGTEAAKRGVGL